ncbi:NAD(P)-binding domain-containing protein, partial [Bacteriovoracaceae bacterium]|nr:NAD(P)-binding domain-containing protein [Bacteriovoracaceae bacterium]
KDDLVEYLEQQLVKTEVKVKFNQEVQKIIKSKNEFFSLCTVNDCFFAETVFVSIGNMSSPRSLGVKMPDGISERLVYDLNNIPLNKSDILVIGGGDSASEYVQILKQHDHNVTLCYRKDSFSKMIDHNRNAVEVLHSKNDIQLIMGNEIKNVNTHENRCLVTFKDDKSISYDWIVAAIGGERPKKYLEKIGIDLEGEDKEEFVESNMQGLFILGDLAAGAGGGSIIKAFNSAHRAIKTACTFYLDCE